MNLHLCLDGVIEDTFPLIDGNDPFNAEAERTAFDRAYEAKESNPEGVVTILIDMKVGDAPMSDDIIAAEACEYLASIDEGEYTNTTVLLAVAKRLRERVAPPVVGIIEVGDRLKLRHDVGRFPHFLATAGSVGTVTVAEKGIVALKMDDHIPGAETWDNEIIWSLDNDESAHEDLTPEVK